MFRVFLLKRKILNHPEFQSNVNKAFEEVEMQLYPGASGSASISPDCGSSAFQPHVDMGVLWPASQLPISAHSSFFSIFFLNHICIYFMPFPHCWNPFPPQHSTLHRVCAEYPKPLHCHVFLLLYVINRSQGSTCFIFSLTSWALLAAELGLSNAPFQRIFATFSNIDGSWTGLLRDTFDEVERCDWENTGPEVLTLV